MNKKISTLLLICLLVFAISGCLAVVPQDKGDLAKNISSIDTTNVISTISLYESEDESIDNSQEESSVEDEMPVDIDYLDAPYLDNIYTVYQYINRLAPKYIWEEQYEENFGITYSEAIQLYAAYKQANDTAIFQEDGYIKFNVEKSSVPEEIIAYAGAANEYIDKAYELWEYISSEEFSHYVHSNDINDPCFHLYEAVRYFSIKKEDFKELNDNMRRGTPGFPFDDAQIDLLFSDDPDDFQALRESMLNPWSVMVGEEIYTARWLSKHSIQDYIDAGITLEMVEKSYSAVKNNFAEYETAINALESKLDAYAKKQTD